MKLIRKQQFVLQKRWVRVAQLMRGDAQKVWLDYRKLPKKTRY